MDRKAFLGVLVALPAGLFLVHCSSSNSNNSTAAPPPAAGPTRSGTQTTYTSSDSGTPAHHHTFAIDDSSLTAPPSSGLSGDTSMDSGHTHSVTISMADLQGIAAGQTKTITTSATLGHSHVFTFMKIA